MPALIAPSPITATAFRVSPFSRAATAMPSAAEIEVDEWAVPKVSYSLSSRRGKPEMPPSWRRRATSARGGRSAPCADRSGGRRPRRGGRAACRRRSAGRSSARPCRGSTTSGRRSARRSARRTRAARSASCLSSRRDSRRTSAGLSDRIRGAWLSGTMARRVSVRRDATTRSASDAQALSVGQAAAVERGAGGAAQLLGVARGRLEAEHA